MILYIRAVIGTESLMKGPPVCDTLGQNVSKPGEVTNGKCATLETFPF